MEYFWTRLSEIRKLKSSGTFGCSETVLAAVKTIVHVFPNKEGIHTFLDDARRENEITNDDLCQNIVFECALESLKVL